MNIDNAIKIIRKRAEYLSNKADTPAKKKSADEMVDAVNVVINYYNTQEDSQSDAYNMREKLMLLSEYLNVDPDNVIGFVDMDTRFMRKRMEARIDMELPEPEWWSLIISDWNILQTLQGTLTRCKTELDFYTKLSQQAGERRLIYAPVIKSIEVQMDTLQMEIEKILND